MNNKIKILKTLKKLIVKKDKSQGVKLLSPFDTTEEEKTFFELAQQTLLHEKRYELEYYEEGSKGHMVVVSPFNTLEDEKLFKECAQNSMNINVELDWPGKQK